MSRSGARRLAIVALVVGALGVCDPAGVGHAHASSQPALVHAVGHVLAATATAWELSYTAVRWVAYSGVLLAAGGALFLVAIHDRERSERQLLAGVVTASAILGVAATLAVVPLHAIEISGGGAAASGDARVLTAVLESAVGTSVLVRLGGLALLLAAVPAALAGGRGAAVTLVGGGAAVASFVLSGHTVTADPRWLALVADACHTLAASVWFGGLVLLGLVLRRRRGRDDAVAGATMVARFSAWATAALFAVAAGGLALAWVEVRSLSAMIGTDYGQTLLTKVAIVAAVVAVGAYNNRLLVPSIRRIREAAIEDGAALAWRRLGWTVRAEVAGLLAALAVTAVLVHLPPPRPFADEPVEHVGMVETDALAIPTTRKGVS